jgi:hypothetical protein
LDATVGGRLGAAVCTRRRFEANSPTRLPVGSGLQLIGKALELWDIH